MISPAVLDAMLAAGCTAEQIVAAVKAAPRVYVYVISPQDDDVPVKVGISDSPEYRRLALECGSPVRLRLVGTIQCPDRPSAADLERRFHVHFDSRRLHGEWFEVNCERAVEWLGAAS